MKRAAGTLLAFLMILALCACGGKAQATYQEQYDLGAKYLSEGNYEQAVIAFTAAIEIDPKQADAYLGLADAYVGLNDYDKAEQALKDGYEATGDESMQEKLDELSEQGNDSSEAPPEADEVSAAPAASDLFPDPPTVNELTVNGTSFQDTGPKNESIYDYDGAQLRGIQCGMSAEDTMAALGLSDAGIRFVEENRDCFFTIVEGQCIDARQNGTPTDAYDLNVCLEYPSEDGVTMAVMGFEEGTLTYLQFINQTA